MRRGYVLFGCIFSIFVLMMSPTVPAVEYNNVKQSSVVSITFDAFKEKLESLGCPATRILLLWEIFCFLLFLSERIILRSRPLAFAIAHVSTYYLFAVGMYFIAVFFADYTGDPPFPLNWGSLTQFDKLAACTTLMVWIILIAIRVAIRNVLVGRW